MACLRKLLPLCLALAALAAPGTGIADPWKDESGKGRGDRHERGWDRRGDRWDDRRDRDRRDDGWGNVRSLDGRVGRVDRSGRRFELRSDRGTVWVSLPYNADRNVRDRFQRLRSGDRVHVSGRYSGNGRFQMDRFR